MNNIELYHKIEMLVGSLPRFEHYPMRNDKEADQYYQAKNAEILHWLQVGEDAIKILKDKIKSQWAYTQPEYRISKDSLDDIMAM